MANASLSLSKLKETNTATIEFEGKEYTLTYTASDVTKLSVIYARLIQAIANISSKETVSTSDINMDCILEAFDDKGTVLTESVFIIKKMFGEAEFNEIISAADVEIDINSVSLFASAVIEAINNKNTTEQRALLDAELKQLDNV